MKKAIKIIACLVGAVLALIVIAILTLPLWLGPVVRPLANSAVPQITKTDFKLGHLALNPYKGRFELGGVVLGNPAGYSEPTAFALSNLVVDVDMGTVGDKYVHVQEVTVEGMFASYVFGGDGSDNLTQIRYNMAGGKEKYEAQKREEEAKRVAKAQEADNKQPAAEEKKDEESAKKVVIDKLTIRDIRVKVGPLTVPVPSLTLTDLGKKSDGLTWAEMGEEIWQAIIKSATSVGDGAKMLGGFINQGTNALGESAGKATEKLGEATGKATEKLGDVTGKATEKLGEATDKLGEGAKKTADAVKGLFNLK